MNIEIPQLSLVVLVGVSGSGKSTFARKHFLATEIVSSDFCRGLVADDENDQAATPDAFEVLHYIVDKRLARGRLTVVDATNVQPESRKSLVELARARDCLAVAIVLNVGPKIAADRNEHRAERAFGMRVVKQQHSQLERGLRRIKHEGFSRVHVVDTVEEIDAVVFTRRPLWNDRRSDHGPFDIIGDVHGCYDELCDLLRMLGYVVEGSREEPIVRPPDGRRALFLGDLVDRGPDSPGVLRLVMKMVADGSAACIAGNHEAKLLKKLRGKDVKLSHGLAATVEQLALESPELSTRVAEFIDALISHYVLDDGKLVVAHAGLRAEYQGRASSRVRSFCLYGDTTGETDEFGLPVRYDWASEYRGRAMVVYGHTPVPEAEWVNGTICIDTGCVFGGKLTALRYPERELVHVDARRMYYEPTRPLQAAPVEERARDVLDIRDVSGKRIIQTRIHHTVTVRAENAEVAIEVMSRFAVDPRWLTPCDTAPAGERLLERPDEALGYFLEAGVERVVCEEKHMGSRAVLVVARDREAAQRRFGVHEGQQGVVYSRTGRSFFTDAALEAELVGRIADAASKAGLWEALETDWMCLDAEIMPWSLKARELVRMQYAGVGAAASRSMSDAVRVLEAATLRGAGDDAMLRRFRERERMIEGYSAAWRRYCWDTPSLADVKVAPFHLMATEGRTWFDRDHVWHMTTLARLAEHEPIMLATRYRVVDLADAASRNAAADWWTELTAAGGEGIVIKPESFIARSRRGLVQPALKCRGREYLRIIYGPEYTAPEHLERLRARGVARKRSLALREFALGVEGLQRLSDREPLWRVHECVFGVLALESEPVDPRL
jgi:protein phosphatase